MARLLYGVCVLCLLSCQGTTSTNNTKVHVEELIKSTTSWNGARLPRYGQSTPEITVLRITIPPKVALPLHEHPVINAGIMLKGELVVKTVNNQTVNLKAGDALVEVVDTWHYGVNEGDIPAVIVVFYAGTVDKSITIKKSSPTTKTE